MMLVEDKIRIKCTHCLVNLQMSQSKLGRKVKCPKCLKVFETDRKKTPDALKKKVDAPKKLAQSPLKKQASAPKKSKKLRNLFLLALVTCAIVAYVMKDAMLFASKPDLALLEPAFKKNANNYAGLDEQEVKHILVAMKKPDVLMPNSVRIPEFSVEQSRPSRDLIYTAISDVKQTLKENRLNGLWKEAENFALAFSFSRDSAYIEIILKSFALEPELGLDDFIMMADSVLTQKIALKQLDPDLYVSFVSKCLLQMNKSLENVKDPIVATKLYYLTLLLPHELDWAEIHSKIKPVLEDAFLHKNATRSDGLFLTPEESAEFSLTLIKIAWQSHLDKKKMPEWLSLLAEKESCRLAYRLEPDGCLPDWSGENNRISRAQEIYMASVVFDRDDLRYIAFCGRKATNAYRPAQKDFDFSEIALEITRTSWAIKNSMMANKNVLEFNAVQVSHDKFKNMISLSVGSTTQMIFKADFKPNQSLKECIHIESTFDGFEVRIENVDLKLVGCSAFLLFNPEDYAEIKTYKYYWFPEPFKILKPSFSVKVEKKEGRVIKLIFKKEPFI